LDSEAWVEIEAELTTMKKKKNVVIHYYEPFDDEDPLIGIYGDPDGLRALAEALLEVASFDQSKNLVQSEGEYWKIRATEDGRMAQLRRLGESRSFDNRKNQMKRLLFLQSQTSLRCS
jgi:hypothetical protein